MNLSLFRKGGEKVVAVVDVGSASAAVAIMAVQKGKPASILAADRAVLPLEERKNEAVISGIGEMVLQAGKNALGAYAGSQKKMGPVQRLYVVVHAPWAKTRTVRANKKFAGETRVLGRMISELAREALSSDADFDRANSLETSVLQVELNGYATEEPEGKLAHEITITGLVSDYDPHMRSTIAASVGQLFPHMTPVLRSGTRATLMVLKERMHIRDYVAVDVASAATTITVVRDGMLGEQSLVSEGVNTLVTRLGSGLPEETFSLMRMLERDHCDESACEKLKEAMARVEPELVKIFGETIGKVASTRRLPNRLVLSTYLDMSPWLSRFFSRIDFTQFTETAQPFIVDQFSSKELEYAVVSERASVSVALSISCALVNKEEGVQ